MGGGGGSGPNEDLSGFWHHFNLREQSEILQILVLYYANSSEKVGFDDLKLAQYCDPPLTTVAQPRFQIGQQAMLLLLEQLNGQTVASGSRLLDSELIIRGSTAAPKR